MPSFLDQEFARRDQAPPESRKPVSNRAKAMAVAEAGLKLRQEEFDLNKTKSEFDMERAQDDANWNTLKREEYRKAKAETGSALKELTALSGHESDYDEKYADIVTRYPLGSTDERFEKVAAGKSQLQTRLKEIVGAAEAKHGIKVPYNEKTRLPDWEKFNNIRRGLQPGIDGMKPSGAVVDEEGNVRRTFEAKQTPEELSRAALAKGVGTRESIAAALKAKDPETEIAALVGTHVNEVASLKQEQAALRQRIAAASAVFRNPLSSPEQRAAAEAALEAPLGEAPAKAKTAPAAPNQAALDWLKANPDDPRAAAVKAKLGL